MSGIPGAWIDRMALFLSTFINRIDKKGRVSVPASFRTVLSEASGQGFAAFPSYRLSALEACGLDRMRQLVQGVDGLAIFSQEHTDFASILFADAEVLQCDTEGRVMLPARLLKHACINDHVAFVGCGSTFQIWDPEAFSAHQAAARARLQSQNMSLGRLSPNVAKGQGDA